MTEEPELLSPRTHELLKMSFEPYQSLKLAHLDIIMNHDMFICHKQSAQAAEFDLIEP